MNPTKFDRETNQAACLQPEDETMPRSSVRRPVLIAGFASAIILAILTFTPTTAYRLISAPAAAFQKSEVEAVRTRIAERWQVEYAKALAGNADAQFNVGYMTLHQPWNQAGSGLDIDPSVAAKMLRASSDHGNFRARHLLWARDGENAAEFRAMFRQTVDLGVDRFLPAVYYATATRLTIGTCDAELAAQLSATFEGMNARYERLHTATDYRIVTPDERILFEETLDRSCNRPAPGTQSAV